MKTLVLFILVFFSAVWGIAQTALDFTITSSDGTVIQLYPNLLDNNKTVVLKFFFVQCPPCNAIAPATEVLYQEWGGGDHDVEFISLSTQSFDDNADVAGYKQMHNLTYPGAGSDGGAPTAIAPYINGNYGTFFGTPTFAVIAPDGTVNFDVRGSGQSGTIEALDAAIAATGATKPGSVAQYSVSGTVYGGDGSVFSSPSIQIGGTTVSDNPYALGTLDAGTDVQITVNIPNTTPVAGISTFDVVLTTQHILGVNLFTEPYQMIAADVNNDGNITTFDAVIMRQLVLQVISNFPDGVRWLVFNTSPDALFSATGNSHTISAIEDDATQLHFTLVKRGDVSGDVYEE